MTYSIIGYVVGALIMSLCHSVLALSSSVRGISVIIPLPLGEGGGAQLVSLALLLILSFFYIVCLQIFYEYSFFSHFFYLILYP